MQAVTLYFNLLLATKRESVEAVVTFYVAEDEVFPGFQTVKSRVSGVS